MGRRLRVLERPVSFRLDGTALVAEAGESVAAALIANGVHSIARSPKFHRPRGASCLRGGCDGCVVRIDGVPNVLGCLEPCREGMVVETQNRVGPRSFDLLRANDWFFPSGMNHHEVFIDVPGAEPFLRSFARRISGLGHFPEATLLPTTGSRRPLPVLVIGGGAAGLAAAIALAEVEAGVELVDENLSLAHAPKLYTGDQARRASELLARAEALVAAGTLRLRTQAKVAGIFSGLVLLETADHAEVLEPALTVLATGAHDGPAVFEGNDLPGVYSLRATRRLLAAGIAPGARVAIVVQEGSSAASHTLAEATAEELTREGVACTLRVGRVVKAHGTSAVRKVTLRVGNENEVHAADALIVEGPRSPSFELAKQAGARVGRIASGFAVLDHRWGAFAAIGELTGAEPDVAAFEHAAHALVAGR